MTEFISNDQSNTLTLKDIKKMYKDYFNYGQVGLLDKFSFAKEEIIKAKGVYLESSSGKKILDATSGFGTQNLGYNHNEIVKARVDFIEKENLSFSRLFFSKHIASLSKNLSDILPGELNYSFFCNSGAEANEGSLKIAYKYHGGNRNIVIHNKNSFHGKLIATSQITDSPEVSFDFQGALNTLSINLEDLDDVEKNLKENKNNIYALILEPFSASLARPFDILKLEKIFKLCKNEDILIIFDEVYSGFYRTSNLFYFMNNKDFVPDILTYSKSFGGGIASISGYTAKKEVFMKAYGKQNDALLHSSTYSNYIEEVFIANKSLEIFTNKEFQNNLSQNILRIKEKIKILENFDNVTKITGDGFHWGIKLKDINILGTEKLMKTLPIDIVKDPRFLEKLYVGSIINLLFNKYNILTYATFNKEIKLIISPPLIIKTSEIDFIFESLNDVLSKNPLELITKFVKDAILNKFK